MIHFPSVGFGHNMDQGLSPARKAMQAEQSMGEAGEKANSCKSNHSSWSRAAAQNSLSHFQNTVIKGKQRLCRYLANCKQTMLQFGEQLHVEHSLFNYLEMTSSRQKGRLHFKLSPMWKQSAFPCATYRHWKKNRLNQKKTSSTDT